MHVGTYSIFILLITLVWVIAIIWHRIKICHLHRNKANRRLYKHHSAGKHALLDRRRSSK